MAKKMRTLPILVLCALVALFVASVLPTSVANAQEKPQFFAKTDDGVNWELYLDGEKLDYASASGKFVDYNNPSAVSAVFFKAIEKELVARGIIDAAHGNLNEYYDIEFGFPSLPAPTTDVASAPYSESREITFFDISFNLISSNIGMIAVISLPLNLNSSRSTSGCALRHCSNPELIKFKTYSLIESTGYPFFIKKRISASGCLLFESFSLPPSAFSFEMSGA